MGYNLAIEYMGEALLIAAFAVCYWVHVCSMRCLSPWVSFTTALSHKMPSLQDAVLASACPLVLSLPAR